MKHRVTLFLSILLSLALLLCSCSAPAEQPSEPAPESESSSEQAPADEQTITIKIGYSTNEEDPRGLASVMFKEMVEEQSGGSLVVEIYPSGQLGGDAALIEAMALDSGTVDMIITDASNFATYDSKMGISAMPFMFSSFEDAWAFMDSDIVAAIEENMIQYNMRILGHYDNGFRCVTTSTDPVESPDDMQGMLIRTPENPVIMATMRALGANPQPLAFSELYMALQQGTYDAQENPIPVIYNNKLYEVQKGLSITNHIYSGMCVTFAESTWNKMSENQQEIVAAAVKESETFNRETNKQMTDDFLVKLEEEGVNIATPDLAPFSAACRSVYDEMADDYGEELLAEVEAWLATR